MEMGGGEMKKITRSEWVCAECEDTLIFEVEGDGHSWWHGYSFEDTAWKHFAKQGWVTDDCEEWCAGHADLCEV